MIVLHVHTLDPQNYHLDFKTEKGSILKVIQQIKYWFVLVQQSLIS